MPAEGIVKKAATFKARTPIREIKMFLEVEVFDLNLEEKEEVAAFFGIKDSFKDFLLLERIVGWKPIENGQVFQAQLKRANGRKCHFTAKAVDVSKCQERRPFCYLNCPIAHDSIKIEAKRKSVAYYYNDGERAWNRRTKVEKKEGKWPDDVKISQRSVPWPTEELLARIFFYPKSEESEYNEKKKEEAIPLLNKILILQKDGEIEYIIDRFFSL